MKRLNLQPVGLTLLLLLACNVLTAQDSGKKGTYAFGFFVDPQITWLKSDNEKKIEGNGSITTINVGFTADKYFADRYAITTGLSLNTIGGELLHKDSSCITTVNDSYPLKPNANIKFRGQYLSIPLGLKFHSIEIGYMSFYAAVGFKANVRLKGYVWTDAQSRDFGTEPATQESIEKEKSNDHFNIAFASYFLGIGMDYSLGGESAIQVGLNYDGGFTGLIDTKQANPASKASITGQAISLRIGFVF